MSRSEKVTTIVVVAILLILISAKIYSNSRQLDDLVFTYQGLSGVTKEVKYLGDKIFASDLAITDNASPVTVYSNFDMAIYVGIGKDHRDELGYDVTIMPKRQWFCDGHAGTLKGGIYLIMKSSRWAHYDSPQAQLELHVARP